MFLLEVGRSYLPALLFCVHFFLNKNRILLKLANPKLLGLILLCLNSYIVYLCFSSAKRALIIGAFSWEGIAPITYSIFFLLQILVLNRNKINAVDSVVIAFFGCYLASVIYEIPYFIISNISVTTVAVFVLYLCLYLFFMYKMEFRFSWILVPALVFLLLFYGLFFYFPSWDYFHIVFWYPRIAPIPLFIVIVSSLKANL